MLVVWLTFNFYTCPAAAAYNRHVDAVASPARCAHAAAHGEDALFVYQFAAADQLSGCTDVADR